MGTYYFWVCRERREYVDVGDLPDKAVGEHGGGYSPKYGSIPHSAWIVASLMLERWDGCKVELTNDAQDELDWLEHDDEDLTNMGFTPDEWPAEREKMFRDVTAIALEDAFRNGLVPDEAVLFMAVAAKLIPYDEKVYTREIAEKLRGHINARKGSSQ